MKRWVLGLLLALSLPAAAFRLSGSSWPQPATQFSFDLVQVDGSRAAPSGIVWNDAFETAMGRWNETTVFRYEGLPSIPRNPCADDGFNGAGFRLDDCGFAFGDTILAITYSLFDGGRLRETDIVFNANVGWDVYSGPLRRRIDFVRVATHELGHALGLGHEDSGVPTIMTSLVEDLEYPQQDDREAVSVLYGGTPPVPDICRQAQLLPLNEVIEAALSAGDCRRLYLVTRWESDDSYLDLYDFQLPKPALVVVRMDSEKVDPYLELYRGDVWIAADDDSGGGGGALLYRRLDTGAYRVWANTAWPFAQSGRYRLQVMVNLDDPPPARLLADWSLVIDGIQVGGQSFRARLSFYTHPADPDGWYWRLESAAPNGDPSLKGALYLPASGKVLLAPVEAFGQRYDAVLVPYVNELDPDGLYWRLEDVWPRQGRDIR